jgi:Mg-chelatase subunit ChlD
MKQTAIVTGSLGAIAQQSGKSIAETFMSADAIVIVDTSGSMSSNDSRSGKSRYDVACEELAALQKSMPGKIAVISFSSVTLFCPNGVPTNLGGGTDLAGALRFAKAADVPDMQFIVISDGQPDEPDKALKIARTYKNHISVIYVGPEEHPAGRQFLEQLAAATGGQTVTASKAQGLLQATESLLLHG